MKNLNKILTYIGAFGLLALLVIDKFYKLPLVTILILMIAFMGMVIYGTEAK